MRRRCRPWALLPLLAATSVAHADTSVELLDRAGATLTLDGLLRDWQGFGALRAVDEGSAVLSGATAWRGADDAAFAFALARDDSHLWVAVEVRDDRVQRSAAHRPTEDALVLSLAAGPAGGRLTAFELALHPGDPGRFAGAVRFRGGRSGDVPGASLVESATGSGYLLEARIPWASLPGLAGGLNTLRARLAYHDSDESPARVDTVIATGRGDAQHPEQLAFTVNATNAGAGGPDLLQRFQGDRSLVGVAPRLDRRVDFAGDGQPERVVVFPTQFVVYGPGVAGGSTYAFAELPGAADVTLVDAQVRDVTGDGRAEVLVRQRVPTGDYFREVLSVFTAGDNGTPRRVFAAELGREAGANRVTNLLSDEAGGGLRVTLGSAVGWSASNYPAAVEAGVEPPLVPWGPDRARVYVFNPASRAFERARSEPNPLAAAAPSAGATPNAAVPTALAPPDVPALLRLFRQQAGLAADAPPNFAEVGDVADDATPEQVHVYGRTLVVVGPAFMGGRNYYQLGLPLQEGDLVLSLRLVDLTGDGKREAVVRVRRAVTSTIRGETVPSQREMVLAYRLGAQRGRIFAAEVGRRVGANSVTNNVRLPGEGAPPNSLVHDAGSAAGWTAETYPFHDLPPSGHFPLLLPWQPTRSITYRWDGNAFVARP